MSDYDCVPCYCKKCDGALRKKRTARAHRAAARKLSDLHSLSKFNEWLQSKASTSRARIDVRDAESDSSSSSGSNDTDSETDSEIPERPAKRPRLHKSTESESAGLGIGDPGFEVCLQCL